jgi:hypothetical protein
MGESSVKNSAGRGFEPDAAAGEAPEIGSHSGDQRDRAAPKPCQLTENGPWGAPRAADSSLLRWPETAPKRVTPGLIPNFQIAGKRRSTPHFPAKPNAHWAPIALSDQALASSSWTTENPKAWAGRHDRAPSDLSPAGMNPIGRCPLKQVQEPTAQLSERSLSLCLQRRAATLARRPASVDLSRRGRGRVLPPADRAERISRADIGPGDRIGQPPFTEAVTPVRVGWREDVGLCLRESARAAVQ